MYLKVVIPNIMSTKLYYCMYLMVKSFLFHVTRRALFLAFCPLLCLWELVSSVLYFLVLDLLTFFFALLFNIST